MRKFHEIKLLLASREMAEIPVIGNVYLLTRGVANLFNSGKLAGCVVSDELLEKCEKYAAGPDKGQAFFRELAAKQLAVFRGLGFAAGYLGGSAKAGNGRPDHRSGRELRGRRLADVHQGNPVLAAGRVLPLRARSPDGLGSPDRFNPQFIASLARPPKSKEVTLNYRLSRFVHRLAFTPGQGLHGLMQRLFRRWDKKPGISGRVVYLLERVSKHGTVWMPGLRRLQPARMRLPLPAVLMLQVRPKRPVRRFGRRPLRVGRQGVHLGANLRAAEELRRIADDARRPSGVS